MLSRLFTLCTFATVLGVTALSAHEGKLQVKTFTDTQIAPHTQELLQLSNQIFKDHPYYYDGNSENYNRHLQSYANTKDAIVVITYDGNKIIGMATGMPFSQAWEKAQETFKKSGQNINDTFYLGELLVLPEYRGRGYGQQMTKEIEKFAKDKGYKSIAAQEIDEKSLTKQAPQGYYSMTNVYKKLGWQERPELSRTAHWVNVNETQKSPHSMTFWTKSL